MDEQPTLYAKMRVVGNEDLVLAMVHLPAWVGEWHPVPSRQVFVLLAGEMEVQVSDNEVRRFRAGSVLLAEDTVGRGHQSRVVGAEDVSMAAVQL